MYTHMCVCVCVCMYIYIFFYPFWKPAHMLQSCEANFTITFPPFMTTKTSVQIQWKREQVGYNSVFNLC